MRPGTHIHARKARTHTHQYVILTAFSTATMIRERASILRYTYIACIVIPETQRVISELVYLWLCTVKTVGV